MSLPDNVGNDLLPLANQAARKVARKLNMDSQTREEFLEAAPGWVAEKQPSYAPSRGDPPTFCYVVLLNKGKDLIRARARRPRLQPLPDNLSSKPETDRDLSKVREAAMSVIEVMDRHLQAQDCVLIAIDCEILSTMEPALVARWLEDAELPEDFAWQSIEAIDKHAARRRALADAMGVNPGWLRQRLHRGLEKIRAVMGGR